jgi:energy-coupling factor transporter ATP-binding protein EcfA2
MSSKGKTGDAVYAAGQARSFLRGDLAEVSPRWIQEFAGYILDDRVLDWLNYHCSLYQDVGENYLETDEAKRIIRSEGTHMANDALLDGDATTLQAMTGLVRSTRDGGKALVDMAESLTHEGYIAGVVGPPGSGKTAMTIDVAEIWKSLTGGYILTNIEKWESADVHVTDSKEAKAEMAARSGQVLLVIDEGSQSLTSRGAEQQTSDAFAKDLKYVRKSEDGDEHAKQGSVVVIGHTFADTAKDIRRLYSAMWEKPSRDDPSRVIIHESEGAEDSFPEQTEYTGITDTSRKYDEHEASSFQVVDDDDDDDDDVVDVEDVQRNEQIKTALKAYKPWSDDDGMSQADAAELTDYSDSWVGDRAREWDKGQYRDLVADPEDESA